MKYIKRPVIVDAIRLMEPNTPDDVFAFCPPAKLKGVGAVGEKMWMEIPTLNGVVRVDYGEWIIKGIKGEFYPCNNEIFKETYEKVC